MHQGLYAKNKPFARQKETLQFCQETFSDHIYLQYIALNIFKKTLDIFCNFGLLDI